MSFHWTLYQLVPFVLYYLLNDKRLIVRILVLVNVNRSLLLYTVHTTIGKTIKLNKKFYGIHKQIFSKRLGGGYYVEI